MLLLAQKIARATNRQVAHGNLKAAAKFSKVTNGRQPLFTKFRQHLVWLIHKIGIGNAIAAANPSPNLVELRQSHSIGIFNKQRVNVGNVDAGLND